MTDKPAWWQMLLLFIGVMAAGTLLQAIRFDWWRKDADREEWRAQTKVRRNRWRRKRLIKPPLPLQ